MAERVNPRLTELAESGRIVKFSRAPTLVAKELRAAQRDLDEARFSLQRGSFKWCTIQAYYSMFHSGRALLYATGYREKSHAALSIALECLYTEPGKLPKRILDGLVFGKELRENADYREDFSADGAKALVRSAEEMLDAARALVSAGE